ncbi:DMT family transporter [Acidimangrovimonas sediminis]|uniref:DMT family transporter n=1 Tax=Acidimangrovimonas sediminis TaxID=2056283 RepID=UPI000C80A494|nr:DMT family transporter [Acidimangrovimonas sediminis]
MTEQNTRLGITLMIATTFVFAVQDGISRHMASIYPVTEVVMIRYWFFALFVMAVIARQPGGLRKVLRPRYPLVQAFRGVLLVTEVCVMILGFVHLGLVEAHAVFTCYPLLITALSGPVLGESVGWRRWVAIGVGFIGVLIILEPGVSMFSPWALAPLSAALMFALYGLLTRFVARHDGSQISFFWTGTTGALAMTVVGVWNMEPFHGWDWGWMGILCCTAALGHYLLIRTYEVAEASAVQPFAYFQLMFASVIGIWVFGDVLKANVALGVAIVISAGLFTLWRAQVRARQERRARALSQE